LQAGTLNPALLLKKANSLGTVSAGKLADLVLLDGDPLVDMHNLRRVAAVFADGKVFEEEERQALFEAVLRDARDPN
jgi:imidazolonepropionase-like amidohydrolase